MNRHRDNVPKKMTEFDEKRLRRQRKDAELPNLLLLDPLLHLSGEDAPEIVLLDRPVRLFMIGIVASDQLDIDRAAFGGMTIGRHGHEDRPYRDKGVPLTDIGRKPEHVRSALLSHSGHNGDPILMLRLHLEKDAFGMIREIIDVHALVVLCAEQHQVVQVFAERR